MTKLRMNGDLLRRICEAKRVGDFDLILQPSYVLPKFAMMISKNWAKEVGLDGKWKQKIVLQSLEGKQWEGIFTLGEKKGSISYACWKSFVMEHDLKVGDACLFSVVPGSFNPVVINVNIIKARKNIHTMEDSLLSDDDNCGPDFKRNTAEDFEQIVVKSTHVRSKRVRNNDNCVKSTHVRSRRVRNVDKATSILRGWLSTTIFDRCFEQIWNNSPERKKNQFMHFPSMWFYMYSEGVYKDLVLNWIKKKNIFSKKYVIVPIVLWNHWYLLILCNLGEKLKLRTERLKLRTRTPCLLLLNSLHEADPRLEPLLRRFMLDIYEAEDRSEDKDLIGKIPLLVPKVPQQRNGNECGIFALYYSSLFLDNAPEDFSISSRSYPYFMKEDWFNEDELEGFYKRLESFELESSDSDE